MGRPTGRGDSVPGGLQKPSNDRSIFLAIQNEQDNEEGVAPADHRGQGWATDPNAAQAIRVVDAATGGQGRADRGDCVVYRARQELAKSHDPIEDPGGLGLGSADIFQRLRQGRGRLRNAPGEHARDCRRLAQLHATVSETRRHQTRDARRDARPERAGARTRGPTVRRGGLRHPGHDASRDPGRGHRHVAAGRRILCPARHHAPRVCGRRRARPGDHGLPSAELLNGALTRAEFWIRRLVAEPRISVWLLGICF